MRKHFKTVIYVKEKVLTKNIRKSIIVQEILHQMI